MSSNTTNPGIGKGKESKYWYRPCQHFPATFKKLASMRKAKELCDICLNVSGRKFYAHKALLVASSPYFEAMFLGGMAESRRDQIELLQIDPRSFELLLNFFYDGELCIQSSNVQCLLTTASVFQVDQIKLACAEFLESQLSPENCLGIINFAEAHGCSYLKKTASRYTISKFVEVTKFEEFLTLSLSQLLELLSKDNLRVTSEEDVYDSVILWVNFDIANRSIHLATLLSRVRLPLLSPEVLVDKVKSNILVNSSLECRDLLDEALIMYHLLPERSGIISSEKIRARKCLFDTGIIYAVGGLNSLGATLSSVERFDSSLGTWESVKPMSTLRSRVGVAVLNHKLYAIGGYDGTSRLATVECYDPKTDEWEVKSPMITRRSALSIAVMEGSIYVIGGYDGNNSLSTMERYDVQTNQWQIEASMHTCRSAAGATVLGKHIYVIGGHDGLSIFNTVEQYDPKSGLWTMVTPMNTRRCRVGVTSDGRYLFSVGGYDGQAFLNTAECYDPSCNKWFLLPSMVCSRSRVGVAAIAKKIYAIGGYDGLSNLNSVEVYDTNEDAWSTAPPMHTHQGGVGVAVQLRD